jgi:hypothetical protein
MGIEIYRIARALGVAALVVSASLQAQDAPLGVVQQANLAHVRQAAVTQGATIYPGEELSTDVSGMMAFSIGSAGFRLLESTRVFFYAGPSGPVGELRRGTLTFRKEAGGSNITIVASDVRIVTKGDGAAAGHVLILSPCEVRVTTVVGQVEVTAGNEKQTMGERETYSVTPDNAVIEVHSSLSPDDPGYHQSHTHKSCRPVQSDKKWAGGPPIGSGSSHFLKVALIGGAVVAGVLLWPKGHDESPSTP